MRHSILAIAVLLIFAGACGDDRSPENPEALQQVLSDYFDGIRDHDRGKMINATTEDFLLYEQGKVWNNDSVFREMDRQPYKVTFRFENFRTVVDKKTGHMTYFAQADFVFDDTIKLHLDFIESAAFRKEEGTWKMNFLHVSPRYLVRYDTIRYAPEYYAKRVAEFSEEPVQKAGIIFLGNSIVEYADLKKLLNDPSVVNRGVAADNTFGVLDRLDDVIARQPEKLFIEIGINDISQNIPNDIIVSNIRTIVDRVRTGSSRTQVYFISILPTNDNVKNEYPDAFGKNDVTDRVNRQLQIIAEESSFVYVDLNAALKDNQGKLDGRYAAADGLHLNDEGYNVLIRMLKSKKYL